MRVVWTLLVGPMGLLMAAGCHSHCSELELAPVSGATALLFDAAPGEPSASDLVYRGDWPSAESSYQFGEAIFYQERFIDTQGYWPFGGRNDYTYRRFATHRFGFGVR